MELTNKTLGAYLEEWAEKMPEKDCIVYPDRNLRFSWKEFNDRVDRLAKGLLAAGLQPGDKLGIWANNVPDWLTFMFATAKAGIVLVTVNTNYRLHELEYLIRNSDLKALCLVNGVRDSDYVSMVYELIPELKICERGRLQSARFPELKHVIFIGPEKHRGMYSSAELILMGSQCDDSRLREIKPAGRLPRCGQYAIYLRYHRFSQRRDADPSQHREQRADHRRLHELHHRG